MSRPHDPAQVEESVKALFPFPLQGGQADTLTALADYVCTRTAGEVFLLNGYAGTGKTTLMGTFVTAMRKMGCNTVLLAPTGRAAKIFSSYSGQPASTIHRRLYRPVGASGEIRYALAQNTERNTIFIVDEASLIGDATPGRPSLLQHLIQYVLQGYDCGLILMGDTAQLPPVGQLYSAAMQPDRLEALGLKVRMSQLDKPLRQKTQSGILHNLMRVRLHPKGIDHISLRTRSFSDVILLDNYDFEDAYLSSLSKVGKEETIVLTLSNWRANNINQQIRRMYLDVDEELSPGEHIMVTRNNYYWNKADRSGRFIANGDTLRVNWLGPVEERYGYRFAESELTFPDGAFITAKLMLSSLQSDGPTISQYEYNNFYERLMEENTRNDIPFRSDTNEYYQALQIKHAYCMTVHKAQGGQWQHVYIDLSGISSESMGDEEFVRWLYTAMSRTKDRLYLLNPVIPVVE